MIQATLAEQGLEALFGTKDENLRRIERVFGVTVGARGAEFRITGDPQGVEAVEHLLRELSAVAERGYGLRASDVQTAIRVVAEDRNASLVDFFLPEGPLAAVRRMVAPRSLKQQLYLQAMIDHDLVISIGPAGTGKTYLAVAMAAAALTEKRVRRIILARPAVEAGEKLGFLPGDLVEKVNPYLRPLYDALYDIIGFEKVGRMLERGIIEVAPIAFMRGRTLNDAFVIIDEAQNTTTEQMKMVLTRIGFGSKVVVPRSLNQRVYLEQIEGHDMVFGVGPAGTGKTYLAVAQAVSHLLNKSVARIVLARPAVEAGEKLGFLPGDLQDKVDPYLRPLYDALYDLLDFERVAKLLERNAIEVAPIAFMRGRTLNDSFVILDEAQNTTTEQMKMFLTRIGYGSKAVINGDVTQVDLPSGRRSGLREAEGVLVGIEGIAFFRFTERDVVRHPLVQQIVTAYDRWDRAREERARAGVDAGSAVAAAGGPARVVGGAAGGGAGVVAGGGGLGAGHDCWAGRERLSSSPAREPPAPARRCGARTARTR